jgi:hypothetical protein
MAGNEYAVCDLRAKRTCGAAQVFSGIKTSYRTQAAARPRCNQEVTEVRWVPDHARAGPGRIHTTLAR